MWGKKYSSNASYFLLLKTVHPMSTFKLAGQIIRTAFLFLDAHAVCSQHLYKSKLRWGLMWSSTLAPCLEGRTPVPLDQERGTGL